MKKLRIFIIVLIIIFLNTSLCFADKEIDEEEIKYYQVDLKNIFVGSTSDIEIYQKTHPDLEADTYYDIEYLEEDEFSAVIKIKIIGFQYCKDKYGYYELEIDGASLDEKDIFPIIEESFTTPSPCAFETEVIEKNTVEFTGFNFRILEKTSQYPSSFIYIKEEKDSYSKNKDDITKTMNLIIYPFQYNFFTTNLIVIKDITIKVIYYKSG